MLYNENVGMVTKEMLSDENSFLSEEVRILKEYAEANERRAMSLRFFDLNDNGMKFVRRAEAARLFRKMILRKLDKQPISRDIFKCLIEDFYDLCSSTEPTCKKLSELFEIC